MCKNYKDETCFEKNRNQCKDCRKIFLKTYRKIYNQKNKEKLAEDGKIYRQNNKNKIKEKNARYYHSKKRNNPYFKLRGHVSKYIAYYMKLNNSSKNNESCLKYLEYDIKDLKDHLEKQFEAWMTWDNYGKYSAQTWDDNDPSTWTWNIDHIIPQSKLPYTSMEDDNFKKCWSLDNLRPLSAKQNLINSNKN